MNRILYAKDAGSARRAWANPAGPVTDGKNAAAVAGRRPKALAIPWLATRSAPFRIWFRNQPAPWLGRKTRPSSQAILIINDLNINQRIIKTAGSIFARLCKNYCGFQNVFIDDWRGYRFVFDTLDVRRCQNNCRQCRLFRVLKDEKEQSGFSPGLYRANKADKQNFGPQKNLNCKTLGQYINCYVNYFARIAVTPKQINDELRLVKNIRCVFTATNGSRNIMEKRLKAMIIEKTWKRLAKEDRFKLAAFDQEISKVMQ